MKKLAGRRVFICSFLFVLLCAALPAQSLREAFAAGDIALMRSMLEAGDPGDDFVLAQIIESVNSASTAVADSNAGSVLSLLLRAKAADNGGTDEAWTPLMSAAALGSAEDVRELLAADGDIFAEDRNEFSPLSIAASTGNTAAFSILLDAYMDVADDDFLDGYTPMNSAVLAGFCANEDIIFMLAEKIPATAADNVAIAAFGAAVGRQNALFSRLAERFPDIVTVLGDGTTLLKRAAENGYFDAAILLLEAGAAYDYPDDVPYRVLSFLEDEHSSQDYPRLLDMLLRAKAADNGGTDEEWTPLMGAAARGDTGSARSLIGAAGDYLPPDAQDSNYLTALQVAVLTNNAAMVQLLLDGYEEIGIALSRDDYDGELRYPDFERDFSYACVLACLTGREHILALLLDWEISPDSQTAFDMLRLAFLQNHAGVRKMLLDADYAEYGRNANGHTLLQAAFDDEDYEMVLSLLDAGFPYDGDVFNAVEAQLIVGEAPDLAPDILCRLLVAAAASENPGSPGVDLLRSVAFHDRPSLEKLLPQVVNGSDPEEYGAVAILVASVAGNIDALRLLFAAVDTTRNEDLIVASLFYSTLAEKLEAGEFLLQNASFDYESEVFAVILTYAAAKGKNEIITLLVDAGVNPDIQTADMLSALAAAAYYNQFETVELLLSLGADIEAVDEWGKTALWYVVNNGNSEAVRLLLTRGANVNVTDEDGSTMLMAAAADGAEEMVRLLLDAGADVAARDADGLSAYEFALDSGNADIINLLRETRR